jgi:hypothetical protein
VKLPPSWPVLIKGKGGIFGFDYRSSWTLGGLPLVHIATTGTAKGIFAIGSTAVGVLAIGGLASGVIAIGGLASGVLAIGGGAFGVFAEGGWAAKIPLPG